MKHKKIKIAALEIVTASLLGGILYSEFGTKKSSADSEDGNMDYTAGSL